MRSAFRTFILLVLILAVPMKAFAAASMLLCGPIGGERAAAEAAHDHGHHSQEAGHAHSSTDPDGSQAPEASTCSACGASCSAAMTSPAVDIAPAILQTSSPIAFFGAPFAGFTPESADRPPLVALA